MGKLPFPFGKGGRIFFYVRHAIYFMSRSSKWRWGLWIKWKTASYAESMISTHVTKNTECNINPLTLKKKSLKKYRIGVQWASYDFVKWSNFFVAKNNSEKIWREKKFCFSFFIENSSSSRKFWLCKWIFGTPCKYVCTRICFHTLTFTLAAFRSFLFFPLRYFLFASKKHRNFIPLSWCFLHHSIIGISAFGARFRSFNSLVAKDSLSLNIACIS